MIKVENSQYIQELKSTCQNTTFSEIKRSPISKEEIDFYNLIHNFAESSKTNENLSLQNIGDWVTEIINKIEVDDKDSERLRWIINAACIRAITP